jgi:glutamine synthetase
VRFIAAATPEAAAAANVEVKPVDGTANPYLGVGAVLAAGLAGIDDGLRLPPSTEEDPSELMDDVRAERGIEQLPGSLAEAADRLAASTVLKDAMGPLLFETFLATRRGEVERFAGVDDDELIRRLRWRF